jgi:glucokinase
MLSGPVLALDLGGTNARVAVVTPDGVLSVRRSRQNPGGERADAILALVSQLLDAALEEHAAKGGGSPVAIGISAPGPLDPRTGMLIDPPNMDSTFHGLPVAPRLGASVGLPWAIGKDTNVALLGEAAFGAGRGSSDLVYLTISTGVGGAVLSGGRLLTGPDGVGGELGHLTVDMDGAPCGCGAKGHLEALSSGTGMARQAHMALDAGAEALELSRIARERAPGSLRGSDVAAAADLGDPVAIRIVERARRAFAASVVSIVDVFGPDRVICGGGISMAWGEQLLGPARDAVAAHAFRTQATRARIVPAELGDDVGLIGTVPLVASALPALGRWGDSQDDRSHGAIPSPGQTAPPSASSAISGA